MAELIEKAREIDCLEEVSGKKGLFVIETLSEALEETFFLDLRNGYSIYGYNSITDEPVEVPRRKIPQEVKDLKSFKMAEGSAQLSDF